MKEKLKEQLMHLQNEYVEGRQKLMRLESRKRFLSEKLLRIKGAITVLEKEGRSGEKKKQEFLTADQLAVNVNGF